MILVDIMKLLQHYEVEEDIFIGIIPAEPDNLVSLFISGGYTPILKEIQEPTFQVRVRHMDYPEGYKLIEKIKNILINTYNYATEEVVYHGFYQIGDIAEIGKDENGRTGFTVNFRTYVTINKDGVPIMPPGGDCEEQIRELLSQINVLKSEKTQLQEQLASLEGENTFLEQEIQNLTGQIELREAEINDLNLQIQSLQDDIQEKDDIITLLQKEINSNNQKINQLLIEISEKNNLLNQQQALIDTLKAERAQLQQELDTTNTENANLISQIAEKDEEISSLNSQIQVLQDDIQEKDDIITRLESDINLKQQQISQLQTEILEKEDLLSQKQIKIDALETEKAQLQHQISDLNTENTNLMDQIEIKDIEISNLNAQIDNLNATIQTLQQRIDELEQGSGDSSNHRIFIDLGSKNYMTTAPGWNNLTDYETGYIENLINNKGELTGIGISVDSPFDSIHINGYTEDFGDYYYHTVSKDGFFTSDLARFLISGLNPNKYYRITVFASSDTISNKVNPIIHQTNELFNERHWTRVSVDPLNNPGTTSSRTLLPSENGEVYITFQYYGNKYQREDQIVNSIEIEEMEPFIAK